MILAGKVLIMLKWFSSPLIIMFQLTCPLCVSVCSRQLYMKAIQKKKYLQVLHLWKMMIRNQGKIIRIYHECEGKIEKSIPKITVWHHQACLVMTNGDPEVQIFLSYPHRNNGFFFLLTMCCFYLFENKLTEVPEYTKMQFHRVTLLDVLGKIALVRL